MRASRSILVLAVAAACSVAPEPRAWSIVFRDLPSGLVSVAGRSDHDVWACGSVAVDDDEPLLLHFDGAAWRRVRSGATHDLWWIHLFESGGGLFVGAGGTILELTGDALVSAATPGRQTVFGAWGRSIDDAWAVGGNPDAGTGFVWRRDAVGWHDVPIPPELGVRGVLYKVWGSAKDDVQIVGASGVWMRWDGARFSLVNTDAKWRTSEKPLFTVSGGGGRDVAVGGFGGGIVLESFAGGVTQAALSGLLGLSGVYMTTAETGWAVGQKLTVLERSESGWVRVATGLAGSEDLHAVWADPSGGVWAVGGDVLSLPMSAGMLIHRGAAISNTIKD